MTLHGRFTINIGQRQIKWMTLNITLQYSVKMDIILSYYYVSQWFSRGRGNTQIEKYVGHIYFQHVLNPCLSDHVANSTYNKQHQEWQHWSAYGIVLTLALSLSLSNNHANDRCWVTCILSPKTINHSIWAYLSFIQQDLEDKWRMTWQSNLLVIFHYSHCIPIFVKFQWELCPYKVDEVNPVSFLDWTHVFSS